jgi:hypothetical protein
MVLKSVLEKTFVPAGKRSPTQCVLNIQCPVCGHSFVLQYAHLWEDDWPGRWFNSDVLFLLEHWLWMLEFWSVRIMFLLLWTILQKTTVCNPAVTFVWKSFKVDSIAEVNVATKNKEMHNRYVNQISEEPQPPSFSFCVNCVRGF